mgnify:CR=1 FL=1
MLRTIKCRTGGADPLDRTKPATTAVHINPDAVTAVQLHYPGGDGPNQCPLTLVKIGATAYMVEGDVQSTLDALGLKVSADAKEPAKEPKK